MQSISRIYHRTAQKVNSLYRKLNLDAILDYCLKLLDKTYVKYHRLFHTESTETLDATFQDDWKAIFREPWLPDISEGGANNELF